MPAALDHIDINILQLLQHDARITTKEIADKLGKSVTPVYERIKKLEETGTIQRYVALLNKDLIGKNLIAFTTVQLKEHSQAALRGFEKEGIKFHEVMECYHLTGQFDFLLKIAIRDMNEYNAFLMNKLATLPNIGVVQTFFVLSESKVETAYSLPTTATAKKPFRHVT
jgi:Lrp/AsnC family leucine-responsive transcriptional regulator